MKKELNICKKWFDDSYLSNSINSQRFYPNEQLVRFIGTQYFSLPIAERKKLKVLEIGCGNCSNLWMLAKEGFQSYGIDISEEVIKLAKTVLNRWNVKVDLKVGNMCELLYEDQFFDLVLDVFSSYCLCEDDFKLCLNEVIRVLKKGGKFFSYSPSTNSDAFKNYKPSRKIDKYTLDGIKRETSPFYNNNYPFRFISPAGYKKLLTDFGLKVSYLETVSRTYRNMEEKFEFVVIVGEK